MIVDGRLRIATGIALLCISKLILEGPPLLQAPVLVQFKRQICYLEKSAGFETVPIRSHLSLAKVTQLKATEVYWVSITHTDTATTNRKQRKRNESSANKET